MSTRPIDQITQAQIIELVSAALREFYTREPLLFHYNNDNVTASERAMAFRIGIYMEKHLQILPYCDDLSVDMEYNRNMDEPKRIHTLFNQHRRRSVIPDLIIHKRQSNLDNLLVIEFKKEHPPYSERASDDEKLRYFTDPRGEYHYRFGMYIELHHHNASVTIYQEGFPRKMFHIF